MLKLTRLPAKASLELPLLPVIRAYNILDNTHFTLRLGYPNFRSDSDGGTINWYDV
jgi:hypothetical protein